VELDHAPQRVTTRAERAGDTQPRHRSPVHKRGRIR
jgi:hypothetical protein